MPRFRRSPHGLYILADVKLARRTVASVTFAGEVRLGRGSYVGAGCVLGYPSRGSMRARPRPTRIGRAATIRPYTCLYEGVTAGERLETGSYVLVREDCAIGDDVRIGTRSILERDVTLGNGVKIHSGCFLSEYTKVEDGVWISPGASFLNDKYPVTDDLAGCTVRRGAIIGANATILPGIEIGEGSVVAACGVVTHDVPANMVVMGCPAREVMTRAEYERKRVERSAKAIASPPT